MEEFPLYLGILRCRTAMRRAIAACLVVVAVGYSTVPAQAQSGPASCTELNISVSLLGLSQTMYGELCVPQQASHTVLVLVPGGSYTSDYWDLPAELGLYSFRAGMNDAGYATLTVDRLGTGRSSHPPSALLTGLVQADVLHQTVQKLRTGSLGPRFDKVIVGGHSLGASISIIEAANYQDVDGVLVASIAHRLDVVDVTVRGLLAFYPALLDPLLANGGYDAGYLTTQPGTRERAFHNPAKPTAAAISHDESTKDAFAATEAADGIGVAIMTPYSALVRAPVLVALGGWDELFCSPLPVATNCSSAQALRQQESLYYSPAAELEAYLLPGNYGHSFNYAPNAYLFQQTVADWAGRKVGR
jgi:pimeloyl-ACP methyl ester carboxylesterase